MRLIDATRLLSEDMKTKYYHLPNGDIAIPIIDIEHAPTVDAVPLDKLCKLLEDMYHCPSSGYPSSGHACHPDCTNEMFATICGMDCDHYSDAERWKAFLINWMEEQDAAFD